MAPLPDTAFTPDFALKSARIRSCTVTESPTVRSSWSARPAAKVCCAPKGAPMADTATPPAAPFMNVRRDKLNLFMILSCLTIRRGAPGSVPSDEQSAIHHHHLSRHVTGGVRRQKHDDVGDLFRLADPAHWDEGA